MEEDVERKGLGTPATRADIIEKLVKSGFVKRDKKQMLPTDEGMKLITVLPESIKSPQLTADWENNLALIAKGEYQPETFLHGIAALVRDLVNDYSAVSEEDKKLFAKEPKKEVIGACPKCGKNVKVGKYGAYCEGKCGMKFARVRGQEMSVAQIKSLINGKKVLMKGLKNKAGKTYNAYFVPDGYEEYSYKDKQGYSIKVTLEFLQNKKEK